MITDIDQRSTRSELTEANLAEYWHGYFNYRDSSPELYQLVEFGLNGRVDVISRNPRPYVDSQQVIADLLT